MNDDAARFGSEIVRIPLQCTHSWAGATGFIGGVLVRRLLADGADVRGLVRDRERARAALPDDPRLELFVGDVLDPATLAGAGDGIDVAS